MKVYAGNPPFCSLYTSLPHFVIQDLTVASRDDASATYFEDQDNDAIV